MWLGNYDLWAGSILIVSRDSLSRDSLTRDLGFCGLIQRTPPLAIPGNLVAFHDKSEILNNQDIKTDQLY